MTVTADQARDRDLDKVNPTSPKRRIGSKKGAPDGSRAVACLVASLTT